MKQLMILLIICILITPLSIAQTENGESSNSPCPTPTENEPPELTLEGYEEQMNIGEVLSPQILGYLNRTGSTDGLQDTLAELTVTLGDDWLILLKDADVHELDIDDDGQDDVLVGFAIHPENGMYYHGNIQVYGCLDGAYELKSSVNIVNSMLSYTYGEIETGISLIDDLNDNGRPEIYIEYIGNLGTGGFIKVFEVFEWEDETEDTEAGLVFRPWKWVNHPYHEYDTEDEVYQDDIVFGHYWQFIDFDDDGLAEVVIYDANRQGPGIFYPYESVWKWKNDSPNSDSALVFQCAFDYPLDDENFPLDDEDVDLLELYTEACED